ncbi:MAG TPA: tetratricopeptide repeat protein [Planctomycetota bacterium]|nr:tetratricopeptide repeat protein [Planctomycetota bacterium]
MKKEKEADRSRPRPCRKAGQACLLCLSLAALARGGVLADSVEFLGGSRQDRVQVVSAKWDNVQYKLPNSPVSASQDGEKVLSVLRDSPLLDRPRRALDAGDYDTAVKDLSAVGGASPLWVQAEAKYLLGRAHLEKGSHREAMEALKAYLDKHKGEKDWFVPFATHALGEALLALKQPQTAEVHFKELAEFKGRWTDLAKIGQAQAVIMSKGAAGAMQARSLLDEVARSRDANASLKNRARVARARVLLLQENPQGVIKELGDSFFNSPRPGEIDYSPERAEATLLMGKAFLAQGGKENLEQAEIWLLRVPAIYRKEPRVYQEACDLLVEVYEKLGDPARVAEWKARREPSVPAGSSPPAAPARGSSAGGGR